MWQGRRWVGVVLSAAVASSMCLGASGPALAAAAGTEVLAWSVNGSVEAGGMYEFGENKSSKFNDYRDMESGFVGELSLRGEKKESPYFFDLWVKNPARDDGAYSGEFGRYGMFRLELGWDRVRHVLSNTATTMFQENRQGNKADFTVPSTLRTAITTTPAGFLNGVAANCGATISWTCPYPVGSATVPTVGNAQFNFIQNTINGLSRPIDYAFNTDVGVVGLRFTPREDLQFEFEYNNRRKEGYRSMSADQPNHPVELPIPIEDQTHEIKTKVEFVRPDYAIQFGYTGSFYANHFNSYMWDSLDSTVTQMGLFTAALADATRTAASAKGELSAPPDNVAHTFNLTGTAALPFRSRINATLGYTMLRQDDTFQNNVPVAGTGITPKNTDDAGRSSPDAKTDLLLGNFLLTSRPLNNVSVTAKYRFFQLQNDMPVHVFSDTISPITPAGVLYQRADGRVGFFTGGGTFTFAQGTSRQERYTKQNTGLDIGWRPIRKVSLKTGYEYEHWNRADIDGQSFGTDEHIAKAAVDVTPLDWLLGRLTYTYGIRNLYDYGRDPLSGPKFFKFNYADRTRNRADLLLELSRWETFTPSLNFGYAYDNYPNSRFGLTDDKNFSAGVGLGWSPMSGLTLSADYTYERHDTVQASPGSATATSNVNDFESTSRDQFHIVGVGAILDVIPKIFDVNLGYSVSFGYTTIKAQNLSPAFTTRAGDFDRIQNVLQTFRIVGRYRLTEKLSVRGGFAYERYNEHNFAKDPMLAFMGNYDRSGTGILANWVGATVPNYEAYITSFFVRYDF